MIGERVSSDENRPQWVPANVPKGVQADQFLHVYYYKQVTGEGPNSHPFEDFYAINVKNPERALSEAIAWWKASDYDHAWEERTIEEWAPRIR
ncbi:hypothetical protein ABTM55_18880, partial [Acinetobacter baumannii]